MTSVIKKGLEHGVYVLFWSTGGHSLASVGCTHDGSNWHAPTNWTTPDNENPCVASTDWSQVIEYRLLLSSKKLNESLKLPF